MPDEGWAETKWFNKYSSSKRDSVKEFLSLFSNWKKKNSQKTKHEFADVFMRFCWLCCTVQLDLPQFPLVLRWKFKKNESGDFEDIVLNYTNSHNEDMTVKYNKGKTEIKLLLLCSCVKSCSPRINIYFYWWLYGQPCFFCCYNNNKPPNHEWMFWS